MGGIIAGIYKGDHCIVFCIQQPGDIVTLVGFISLAAFKYGYNRCGIIRFTRLFLVGYCDHARNRITG